MIALITTAIVTVQKLFLGFFNEESQTFSKSLLNNF